MCAGTCAGECERVHVDVCRSSSVNIVLCSSSSSSSGSAVAARSTVYFPSWRTTSYQISRRCLLARCPTMRSQRISRPLSSGPSYSGASSCPRWLTPKWTSHTTASFMHSIDSDCSNLCQNVFISSNVSVCLQRYSHTEQMRHSVFSTSPWQPPQLWQKEIRADGGSHNGGIYEPIWVWRVPADTWMRASEWMNEWIWDVLQS